jgi:hypothetical protein
VALGIGGGECAVDRWEGGAGRPGLGVGCFDDAAARGFGEDVPVDFESEDNFLPVLRRTHPSDVAGPKGVFESCGALLDLTCPKEELLLVFLRCLRLSLCLLEGTSAREDCDSRWESCSKVWMASIREALERFTSAW